MAPGLQCSVERQEDQIGGLEPLSLALALALALALSLSRPPKPVPPLLGLVMHITEGDSKGRHARCFYVHADPRPAEQHTPSHA